MALICNYNSWTALLPQVQYFLAKIYERYQCELLVSTGFNVCLCRDTWNNRNEILLRKKRCTEGTQILNWSSITSLSEGKVMV
jgi:hypothetical protein